MYTQKEQQRAERREKSLFPSILRVKRGIFFNLFRESEDKEGFSGEKKYAWDSHAEDVKLFLILEKVDFINLSLC